MPIVGEREGVEKGAGRSGQDDAGGAVGDGRCCTTKACVGQQHDRISINRANMISGKPHPFPVSSSYCLGRKNP